LALLEASQRRDWLAETKSKVIKPEPDSSMSTDKGSYRDSPRMESRDEHAADRSVALPLPGELPSQLPDEADGTASIVPMVPMRSKETRRTSPAPSRIQRISSLNSAKEKRSARTGDGPCPSPRIRARRRSEGNAAASAQRVSIEALKDVTAQKPATLKSQREAADPRDSGAASLVEPASPRRFNKHLIFADDEAGPPLAVVPSGSPLPSPLPPPSPLHGPSSPAVHPVALNNRSPSIDGNNRIISASSLWADTWSRDLSQASKRSGGRSEKEPLSYSQSSSSLDSNPLQLPSLSHVACQTDVIWKEGDWHCTRCAKPPSLPSAPLRTPSKGKSRVPSKPRMKQAMELVGKVQGTWRLVYGPPNVSPWLKEFTIYRTDVFSEDAAKKLDFVETVRLTLGGGELILDNEEYLHRHGRSGQHLMFERTEDDYEFDDENVFVRQFSGNSVESDSTCGGQVDADMGPWY